MNLRFSTILLITMIIGSFFSGCVKEDTDNCDTSHQVNLHFYTRLACDTDTIYSEDIRRVTYGVFDNEGVLVSYQENVDVTLGEDRYYPLEVNSGLYSIVAFSGLDEEDYIISDLRSGITTKSDLMFRLRRDQNRAYSIAGKHLFYGHSPVLYVPENPGPELNIEPVNVNMQEITNRITIIVEGLDNAENYDISIETDNGSMNLDGTIAADAVIECGVEYERDNSTLVGHFTLLKLETGRTNTIVIRNLVLGTEIFRGNLLGTLLLKNPEINLNCDHDFFINFTTEDQCECGTYIIAEIRVNDWLVHSYQTEMK